MNKFLNKSIKGKKVKKPSVTERGKALSVLGEFQRCWESLEQARQKARRSFMYAFGNQWGDSVRDPDTGFLITEEDFIKKNGKVPLKNNMITPIINNIDGQFRSTTTKPICIVRDQGERKIGEMMSMAIEYVHDLNEVIEVDADTLRRELCSGIAAQRVEYGINPSKQKKDAWVFPVNTYRIFFNTNIEDVRAWDLTCIGELFDLSLNEVKAAFAKTEQDKEWINDIYGRIRSDYAYSGGLQGKELRSMTFYTPVRSDMCRVILGWKLVTDDSYYWHDTLNGTWGYKPYNKKEKEIFDFENKSRIEEALVNGISEEDVLLIEYEYKIESYWKYWYLTPHGDILQSGRSPYWHGEHNYVLNTYPMLNGQVLNYIEQFIDQQRSINRTATLIDFMRSTSSKGLLICDDTAFEGMDRQEIVDEYVRYNGVLFVRPRPGVDIRNVIHQVNSNVSLAGDFELLNIQLKLINDISGVNNAMQGKDTSSSTPASLYAQQTQNASNNLRGIFDNFRIFRRRRDYKLMKTIQQYYTERTYIDIAGKDYSEEAKLYDPEKVQNAEIDLSLADGNNSPAYQMLQNDILMQLLDKQVIDGNIFLENSSLPFASKILDSIKRNQEQLQEMQQMQGVSPDILQQVQQQSGNPALMQQLLNDKNSSSDDGLIMKSR